jgi:hypothetical protein
MLTITVTKDLGSCVPYGDMAWKLYGDASWIDDDPVVQEIIYSIDNAKLVCPGILSGMYGNFTPDGLSAGAKTCILIYKAPEDLIMGTLSCGDNCAEALKIAADNNPTANCCILHPLNFIEGFNFKTVPFEAVFTNNNIHVHDSLELSEQLLLIYADLPRGFSV